MAVTWECHIINSPFRETPVSGYGFGGNRENIAGGHCVTKIIIS
jgi:hypothetical protein